VIAVNLTGKELATKFPKLSEKIQKSIADPLIWAGVEGSTYDQQIEKAVEVTSP